MPTPRLPINSVIFPRPLLPKLNSLSVYSDILSTIPNLSLIVLNKYVVVLLIASFNWPFIYVATGFNAPANGLKKSSLNHLANESENCFIDLCNGLTTSWLSTSAIPP